MQRWKHGGTPSLLGQCYWAVAVAGTTLMLVMLVLSFFALDSDGDVDMDGPEGHPSGLGLLSTRAISAFVMFFLFDIIFIFVFGFVGGMIGSGAVFPLLELLATLIPRLAVMFRRLHDSGHSGWWLLVNAAPFLGPIVVMIFMVMDSDRGKNQYGPNPKAQEVGAESG